MPDMKLLRKKVATIQPRPTRGSRGPAATISKNGADRFTMWLDTPLRDRIDKYNQEIAVPQNMKRLGYATVLRTGGKEFIERKFSEAMKAKSGRLHAKIRPQGVKMTGKKR